MLIDFRASMMSSENLRTHRTSHADIQSGMSGSACEW